MKTIKGPLIGSCPSWDDKIPDHRLAEFRSLVGQVQQEILRTAARGLITLTNVRQWHEVLFKGFVPLRYYAGNFRADDWTQPCLGQDVAVAGVRGSPFAQVLSHMENLLRTIHAQIQDLELNWAAIQPSQRAMKLALVVANLVGGFVKIHPFINGNGRTSRLLWRWGLLRFGVPVQCCVYPRPDPPYGDLMQAAMRGDFQPLALFVLQHLASHAPQQN